MRIVVRSVPTPVSASVRTVPADSHGNVASDVIIRAASMFLPVRKRKRSGETESTPARGHPENHGFVHEPAAKRSRTSILLRPKARSAPQRATMGTTKPRDGSDRLKGTGDAPAGAIALSAQLAVSVSGARQLLATMASVPPDSRRTVRRGGLPLAPTRKKKWRAGTSTTPSAPTSLASAATEVNEVMRTRFCLPADGWTDRAVPTDDATAVAAAAARRVDADREAAATAALIPCPHEDPVSGVATDCVIFVESEGGSEICRRTGLVISAQNTMVEDWRAPRVDYLGQSADETEYTEATRGETRDQTTDQTVARLRPCSARTARALLCSALHTQVRATPPPMATSAGHAAALQHARTPGASCASLLAVHAETIRRMTRTMPSALAARTQQLLGHIIRAVCVAAVRTPAGGEIVRGSPVRMCVGVLYAIAEGGIVFTAHDIEAEMPTLAGALRLRRRACIVFVPGGTFYTDLPSAAALNALSLHLGIGQASPPPVANLPPARRHMNRIETSHVAAGTRALTQCALSALSLANMMENTEPNSGLRYLDDLCADVERTTRVAVLAGVLFRLPGTTFRARACA